MKGGLSILELILLQPQFPLFMTQLFLSKHQLTQRPLFNKIQLLLLILKPLTTLAQMKTATQWLAVMVQDKLQTQLFQLHLLAPNLLSLRLPLQCRWKP